MDISTDLLFMEPVFHGKIWGGRKLEEMYGYEIPDGPVGECWGISAHPNGDCKIASGPLAVQIGAPVVFSIPSCAFSNRR